MKVRRNIVKFSNYWFPKSFATEYSSFKEKACFIHQNRFKNAVHWVYIMIKLRMTF